MKIDDYFLALGIYFLALGNNFSQWEINFSQWGIKLSRTSSGKNIFSRWAALENRVEFCVSNKMRERIAISEVCCEKRFFMHTLDLPFAPGWLLPQNSTRFSTEAHRDRSEATAVITTPYVYWLSERSDGYFVMAAYLPSLYKYTDSIRAKRRPLYTISYL